MKRNPAGPRASIRISGSFGAAAEQGLERRAVDHELRLAIEEAVRQIHPARVEVRDHAIDRVDQP
jgi:hypothetical protein